MRNACDGNSPARRSMSSSTEHLLGDLLAPHRDGVIPPLSSDFVTKETISFNYHNLTIKSSYGQVYVHTPEFPMRTLYKTVLEV